MKIETVTSLTVEALVKNTRLPDAVRLAFRRSIGSLRTQEQLLWREVAARMTLDAFGIVPGLMNMPDTMSQDTYTRFSRAVREARVWFSKRRYDAAMVFEMAEVDLTPVLRLVLALPPLARPTFIRAEKPRQRKAA